MLSTHLAYCNRLKCSWSDLQIIDFELVQLTSEQRQFKVDRVFQSDGELFVVCGLSWDKTQKDYCVWYREHGLLAASLIVGGNGVHHRNFKSYALTTGRGKMRTTSEVAGMDSLPVTWH